MIDFIKREVIEGKRVVSMTEITEVCEEDATDRKKRQRIKEKIEKLFPNLTFLSSGPTSPQIVVSSLKNLTGAKIRKTQKEESIKAVAQELRNDIIELIQNAPSLPWPPTADDLLRKDREAPASVIMFLLHLLQDYRHKSSETTEHHVWSYSQDFLHSISRRSFMTAKHPLLASTIHTMTGQSTPINILSQLRNCSSYTTLRKITGQADLSQHLAAANKPLPVQAISPENSVLTHFW